MKIDKNETPTPMDEITIQDITRAVAANPALAHFVADVASGTDFDEAVLNHCGEVLGDAEQRGYLRGRNEAVAAATAAPELYQSELMEGSATTPVLTADPRPMTFRERLFGSKSRK